MGYLARIFERTLLRQADEILGPVVADATLGDRGGAAENWANPDYAHYIARSVGVYACTKLRSDALSKPRLRISARAADGELVEVAPNHPARALFDRVNPWWSRGMLWRATETSLSLWGQSFWGIARNNAGQPSELYWLRPDRIKVVPSADSYIQGFLYSSGRGPDRALAPSDVFWLRYFNPMNEFTGLSPIAAARLSIETGLDATQSNRSLVRNRGVPSGVLTRKNVQTMTDDQVEEIRKRWARAMQGPDNVGRLAVLFGDTEYQAVGLSPADVQYVEGQRLSLEDVCRVFQVPPPLVADLERATYSNTDQLVRFFYQSWLVDELTWITEEINEMIMPTFGGDLVAWFDLSDLEVLHEDANARTERELKMIAAGRSTINEIRRASGESDLDWGDAWWAPLNLVPITGGAGPTGAATAPPASGRSADPVFVRLSAPLKEFAVANVLLKQEIARKFTPRLDRFFGDQADRVLRRFRELPDELPITGDTATVLLPSSEDADLADAMRPLVELTLNETTALIDKVIPAPETTLAAVGQPARNGYRQPQGLDDPLVHWLFTESARRVVQIDNVTLDALRYTLALAADRGYSRYQIANGVPADGFVGINDLVEQLYTNRGLTIARTETAWASNATASDRYKARGITRVEILDGKDCGWESHDAVDKAHGTTRSLADLDKYPIAHPNCVRVPIPVVEGV